MAQHNVAAYAAPASGATGWNTPLETALAAQRAAINDTDSLNDARFPKFTLRGAWAANTAYVLGDVVIANARLYFAPSGFTSGSTFSAANWIDLGPQTITINGSGPDSSGNFTVSGSGSTIPANATRFLAGQAYSSSLDYGAPSNITPTLNRMLMRRWLAGRSLPAGSNLVASWFQNTAVASSFFRPVIYTLNPADLSLTLVCDFGQVDTSSGAGVAKASAATPTVAAINPGDLLMVGGAGQGASPTVQGTGSPDAWLPAGTAGPATGARSQGLYLDGVSGAAPSTVPALGASGGVTVMQGGSASIPLVYLTAQS